MQTAFRQLTNSNVTAYTRLLNSNQTFAQQRSCAVNTTRGGGEGAPGLGEDGQHLVPDDLGQVRQLVVDVPLVAWRGAAAVRQRGEARNPYLAPRVTASGTGYNANRGSTCHRALLWEVRVIALAVAAARVSEFTCNNPYLPLKLNRLERSVRNAARPPSERTCLWPRVAARLCTRRACVAGSMRVSPP